MHSSPRRVCSRPSAPPLRRDSCTCGTASRQNGHCVSCTPIRLPQYAHCRVCDGCLPKALIRAPGGPLPRLGSRPWHRQGMCGPRVRGFLKSLAPCISWRRGIPPEAKGLAHPCLRAKRKVAKPDTSLAQTELTVPDRSARMATARGARARWAGSRHGWPGAIRRGRP